MIDALTGVRAVAVLLVFIGHLLQIYFPGRFDNSLVAVAPYFGMTTFFVLSGFVIHWNYARLFALEPPKVAWRKFFAARFSRLFPLHLAVVIFGAVDILGVDAFSLEKFVSHVFMLQAWIGRFSYYGTWSVSVEWFFYLVYAAGFPFIAWAIRSRSPWLLAGIVLLSFQAYWLLGPARSSEDMWLRYDAPYFRVLEFLTGVVAAQVVAKWNDFTLLAVLAITAWLYGTEFGRQTNVNYLVAPLVAVMLIVACRKTLTAKVLSAKWLLWIGDRSYAIYLMEGLYFGTIGPPAETLWQGFTYSTLCVISVIVIADICWRNFEMPARKAIKHRLAGTQV